ncbi:MAG: adenine methyltransferase [Actinomycetes bacterium]|nr:MAG: adenine methyltransferase [Actinomycetes bacterium]
MSDEPEKVEIGSPDLAAENFAALEERFPGVVADGVLDAARLGELTGTEVAGLKEGAERYGLMWAGKNEAVRSLLTPSRAALVPDLERSVDFDTAENVFIEGDNLEVLKLLQKAYNDQVKLIYIDPPYNTGNDFVYNDDFSDGLRGYLDFTGQVDEEGAMRSANAETGGRKHSRWLSMMYPRLVLARNLLTQDGAIFVSIDFNEVASLRLLMDEVFGETNFQREIIWRIGWLSGYKTQANNFIRNHDTMLFYSRDPDQVGFIKKYIENEHFKPLLKKDSTVTAKLDELGLDKAAQAELLNFINHENRPDRYPIEDTWNSNEYDDLNSIAIVSFSGEKVSKLLGVNEEYKGQKSVKMLRRIIEATTSDDDVVLDFFAGSGSTAHAVLDQNSADGGRRRCISVNIPEPLDDTSEAFQAGYQSVNDIAISRIAKVMAGVVGAKEQGLRIFSLEESNFRIADDENLELDLSGLTLIRGNAEGPDLAAEILLSEGVRLDKPWEWLEAAGVDVVRCHDVAIVLGLDLTEEVVEAALELKPRVLVFLEDGFANNDSSKANAFYACQQAGIAMKTV